MVCNLLNIDDIVNCKAIGKSKKIQYYLVGFKWLSMKWYSFITLRQRLFNSGMGPSKSALGTLRCNFPAVSSDDVGRYYPWLYQNLWQMPWLSMYWIQLYVKTRRYSAISVVALIRKTIRAHRRWYDPTNQNSRVFFERSQRLLRSKTRQQLGLREQLHWRQKLRLIPSTLKK